VKYVTMGFAQHLLVSKYLINLPREKELKQIIETEKEKDCNYISIFKNKIIDHYRNKYTGHWLVAIPDLQAADDKRIRLLNIIVPLIC